MELRLLLENLLMKIIWKTLSWNVRYAILNTQN